MKIAIGMTLVFGTIAMFLWNSVPRLMSDLWHAREYVPAQNHTITNYKCTNWNGFMFNECTVTFVPRQGGKSQEFTDWRLGRAPHDPVRLMQRGDNASSLTTDVSLQTVWNRLFVAVTGVGFGIFLVIVMIAMAFKDDEPIGESSGEPSGEPSGEADREPSVRLSRAPSPQPMGRGTFGKRQA